VQISGQGVRTLVLILLVDNLHDARQLHRQMLETLGHRVIEATDGKRAIQVAAASNPDTIVMDLGLSDIDGLLAIAALRTISPLRDVPIVAVADLPADVLHDQALAAGCSAYVEKPLTMEKLSDVLAKI
jgi:CheY-like chemotaxis protein